MPQHVIQSEAVKFSSFGGDWDASSGVFPTRTPLTDPSGPAPDLGDWFRVGTAGTTDGVEFRVGEYIVFKSEVAATGTFAGDWYKLSAQDFTAMSYKGAWAPSSAAFPSGALTGDIFKASDTALVDSVSFQTDDLIMALVDAPSTLTYTGNWQIIPTGGSTTKVVQDGDADTGIVVEATPDDDIIAMRSIGVEVLRVHTDPALVDLQQGVEADRDIRWTSSSVGPVIESPNGTRWRFTIDDSGFLTMVPLP